MNEPEHHERGPETPLFRDPALFYTRKVRKEERSQC